jgi:hypothetical protein
LGCREAKALLMFLNFSSQGFNFAVALLDQSIEALTLLGKNCNFVFRLSSEALFVIFQIQYFLLEVFSLAYHRFVFSSEPSNLAS